MDHSHPEIGESGYSSEKASAVTSPISLDPNNDFNNDINNLTSLEDGNLGNNADITQIRHLVNINMLTSPSPTDVSMTDLIQIRMLSEKSNRNVGSENEASATTLSTSMIPNSNVTSPEAPTASLSSSVASKESPTSPVNDTERLYILLFKYFKNFIHTYMCARAYSVSLPFTFFILKRDGVESRKKHVIKAHLKSYFHFWEIPRNIINRK